jgi:hypothetical protein
MHSDKKSALMRICILIPSVQYMKQAGARIRYQRLLDQLAAIGTELNFTTLDNYATEITASDVYIFSKCYDLRSVLIASHLRNAGRLVGLDFFDDYFTQSADSRFDHMRETMRSLVSIVDFTLCSTLQMEEVVKGLFPDSPFHTLNDPYEYFDPASLGNSLAAKLERARSTSSISVAWFGQGENKSFPVGLRDLASHCADLSGLAATPFKVKLTILTHPNSFRAENLQMLRRIDVPFELEEWSEERERELLGDSLVCFLPVNAQAFSIAKSLNRCVSALTNGAQVLSSGYPLYDLFDDFIYRRPLSLIRDLGAGQLALRIETIGELGKVLQQWSSPMREAHKLAQFLFSLLIEKRARTSATPETPGHVIALLQGAMSTGASHKVARTLGYLSVGTPYSSGRLGYDVDFRVTDEDHLEVCLAQRASTLLRAELKPLLQPTTARNGHAAKGLDLSIALQTLDLAADLKNCSVSKLRVLSTYGPLMAALEGLTAFIFPGVRTFVSEETPYLVGSKLPARSYAEHQRAGVW